MNYENTSRSADRPFHVRARAVAEHVLNYLERGNRNDPDVEALAAFSVLYGAVVADKSLRFEMARHNAELETAQRDRELSARVARLASLDLPKSGGAA